MAVIALHEGDGRVKAAWVFDRLLADVLAACADAIVADAVACARAIKGLIIYSIREDDPETADKIVHLVRRVVDETLAGVDAPYLRWRDGLDEEGRTLYLRAVADWADLLHKAT